MSQIPHVADAENEFRVVTITPDFCRVGKAIIPFFPTRVLKKEHNSYAQTVFARSEKILMVDSIVQGTTGNAGSGIKSGVSGESGHVQIIEGADTVLIEGRRVAREDDKCWMNCKS